MPLLDRDTIIDRPVLVDRGDEGDEQGEHTVERTEPQVLGNGGGPVINNIEFEKGHYNIVAAANLAAVLATGREEGSAFEDSFINASIQVYELIQNGEDISDLVRFSIEKNVAEIGLTEDQTRQLREEPDTEEQQEQEQEPQSEPERVEQEQDSTDDEEESTDVGELEEELEEVKGDEEDIEEEED